jgi:FkbM family methyltransferase
MQAPYAWSLSPTWLAHAFKAVARQHHREMLPLLRRFVPRDAVVFDVGAHAGQFAKLFSELAEGGRIYAFEPGSYARSVLRLAIAANRRRNVAIVPIGLGEKPGISVLTLPIKRPGSYRFGLAHLGPHGRPGEVCQEVIPLTTIDAFAATVALDRLDFVKCDVEGWEMHVVRGGLETLRRFRPPLLLELDGAHLKRGGDTLEAVWAALTGLGYAPHLPEGERGLPLAAPTEGDILWLPA